MKIMNLGFQYVALFLFTWIYIDPHHIFADKNDKLARKSQEPTVKNNNAIQRWFAHIKLNTFWTSGRSGR